MPQITRSLLRARNSRVSTAVTDSASSCAISSVVKPPIDLQDQRLSVFDR